MGDKWKNILLFFKQFYDNFRSKTPGFQETKLFFRDAKWCFKASWGSKGLTHCVSADQRWSVVLHGIHVQTQSQEGQPEAVCDDNGGVRYMCGRQETVCAQRHGHHQQRCAYNQVITRLSAHFSSPRPHTCNCFAKPKRQYKVLYIWVLQLNTYFLRRIDTVTTNKCVHRPSYQSKPIRCSRPHP